MTKETLKKGTRIYYNGDMANEEGLGVITSQVTDQFGTVVNIKMDDGRTFPSLPIAMFSEEYLGHGGTRFVMEEAYRKFRQAQITKVETQLKEAHKGFRKVAIDKMEKDRRKTTNETEPKLMKSLKAFKLGLEYQAKSEVEKQLEERKKGHSGEFNRGKGKAYEKAAESLGKIIKEGLK